jgi:hypothetical protein
MDWARTSSREILTGDPQGRGSASDGCPSVRRHQALQLVEPIEDDPSRSAEATPCAVRRMAKRRHDMTSPAPAPNGGRVVAAIHEHTIRPLPRAPRRRAAEERHPPTAGLFATTVQVQSRSAWCPMQRRAWNSLSSRDYCRSAGTAGEWAFGDPRRIRHTQSTRWFKKSVPDRVPAQVAR